MPYFESASSTGSLPVRTVSLAYGDVAQLGERLHGMQEVRGSIPLFSTNTEGLAVNLNNALGN